MVLVLKVMGTAEAWYHVAGSESLKGGQEVSGEDAVSVAMETSGYWR